MKPFPLLLLLLGLGFCLGCTSHAKKMKAVDWSQRVGHYTFAQAVAEWGKPHVVSETSTGRVAEWHEGRGGRPTFSVGLGGGSYGRGIGTGVGVGTSVSPPPHGLILRLTFDTGGVLQDWSRTEH